VTRSPPRTRSRLSACQWCGVAKPGLTEDDLVAAAEEVGYPVLVKPSAGGGGKGMRLVEDPARLREALSAPGARPLRHSRRHAVSRAIRVAAQAYRGASARRRARQRSASRERECSLQRRHQKVIEEAPSALLDAATRARIGAAACDTARSVDYVGSRHGGVHRLRQAADEFFFMEMNTRLQVEHPVTEAVTGLDSSSGSCGSAARS